jgi:transposase-like protein
MNLGDPISFKVPKREHTRMLLSKYSIKEVAQILGIDLSNLYRYRREEQIERVVPPPQPPAQPPLNSPPNV